jgi:hypothetical protein
MEVTELNKSLPETSRLVSYKEKCVKHEAVVAMLHVRAQGGAVRWVVQAGCS